MAKSTQLAQASLRLREESSSIGVQAGNCGSSKQMMFIYLVTEFSGLSVGPVFKGHALNLEEQTDRVSSYVGI